MKLNHIPRVNVAFTPTPLQPTRRLAQEIGLNELYFKRDDNTGLAVGGNKARKLEYLLADALDKGADTILTVGGPQSNHCRMTAAAARACGLDAILIFGGPEVSEVQGNMVIDQLLGAKWTFTKEDQTRDERMQEVAEELRKEGKEPYLIPLGGSNALGALGYVRAGMELAAQCQEVGLEPDYIVHATGSGGTQAGLIMGSYLGGLKAKVIGVSVSDSKEEMEEIVHELLQDIGQLIAVEPVRELFVKAYDEFVGEGYGVPTEASQKALETVALSEAIIIDPVYTAKAFSGLMGLVADGTIKQDDTVVFVHTGGSPALFADTSLYWGRK